MSTVKLFWHRLKSAWWMFRLKHNAREKILYVSSGIIAADDMSHDMVWGRGTYTVYGVEHKMFYILCTKTESSLRAYDLLEKDLPLCSTDLGDGYSTENGL